jgi:hypothetical protein
MLGPTTRYRRPETAAPGSWHPSCRCDHGDLANSSPSLIGLCEADEAIPGQLRMKPRPFPLIRTAALTAATSLRSSTLSQEQTLFRRDI